MRSRNYIHCIDGRSERSSCENQLSLVTRETILVDTHCDTMGKRYCYLELFQASHFLTTFVEWWREIFLFGLVLDEALCVDTFLVQFKELSISSSVCFAQNTAWAQFIEICTLYSGLFQTRHSVATLVWMVRKSNF